MLTQTMVDDGPRFNLACDGCGISFTAREAVRGDAGDLWLAAYWVGWRLTRGDSRTFGHRCASCVAVAAGSTA